MKLRRGKQKKNLKKNFFPRVPGSPLALSLSLILRLKLRKKIQEKSSLIKKNPKGGPLEKYFFQNFFLLSAPLFHLIITSVTVKYPKNNLKHENKNLP